MKCFLGAGGSDCGESFGDQESVGRDAQGGVMVDATPSAPFVMAESEVLFEIRTPHRPEPWPQRAARSWRISIGGKPTMSYVADAIPIPAASKAVMIWRLIASFAVRFP